MNGKTLKSCELNEIKTWRSHPGSSAPRLSRDAAVTLGAVAAAVLLLSVAWAPPAARGADDLLGPARLAPTPMAPVPEVVPWTEEYASRQARFVEAQTKARGLAWRAEAERRQAADPAAAKRALAMADYDARHYDLNLTLSPTTQTLTGVVTVTAVVTGPSLDVLELDLKSNMIVSACTAGGLPAAFDRPANAVGVHLDRAYATGETVVVTVAYSGNPAGDYFGWSTYGTQPLIWTLSEPYGARDWWPCKDLNSDKADSVDIWVTLPDNLIVASNGVLLSDVDNGATRTFHWRERHPIATYLVSVTAHPFAVFSHWYTPLAGGDPMEVRYFVVPARLSQAQTGYAPTVSMITAFAQAFGEYPFLDEKYGHAHFLWGGGMEHQTCTSLYYGSYSQGLISHELSHQWWGDLITCADFHHIWLNEGFATWCEAFWREKNEGMAAYHAEMNAARYFGAGTIYVEDPSDFNEIFNGSLSYNKGSWVVHMLRHILGDDDFFAALLAYRQAYGNGSATTEQFRDVCEAVSGKDLDAFFQQWIYGEYYPVYDTRYWFTFEGDSTRVAAEIRQVQTVTGLFTMPLDLRVATSLGAFTHVVQNSEAVQTYEFRVPGLATALAVDPDEWVLRTTTNSLVTGAPGTPPAPVLALAPNWPNPFNPATTIPFALPRDARVRLAIYDAAGRLVRVLVEGERPAGSHTARWDGTDALGRAAGSGVYFARLTAAGEAAIRPLVLAR